jgi:chromosome segregation ATPase
MSDWYEIDAAWDANGYASDALLKLGETREWSDLVGEVAKLTHATAEEAYDGMAKALRDYLESLDGLMFFTPEQPVDNAQADSREKLEADLRKLMRNLYEVGYTDARINQHAMLEPDIRHAGTDFDPERGKKFIELLDRQEAITEREFWEGYANGNQWEAHQFETKCNELTAERDELLAELESYRDFEKAEFAIPLDEAMKFTTDPPGYIKKHIAELQAERDMRRAECDRLRAECDRLREKMRWTDSMNNKLRDELTEKQHVCDVQRDSFLKMERELAEANERIGELERTIENMRGME